MSYKRSIQEIMRAYGLRPHGDFDPKEDAGPFQFAYVARSRTEGTHWIVTTPTLDRAMNAAAEDHRGVWWVPVLIIDRETGVVWDATIEAGTVRWTQRGFS